MKNPGGILQIYRELIMKCPDIRQAAMKTLVLY